MGLFIIIFDFLDLEECSLLDVSFLLDSELVVECFLCEEVDVVVSLLPDFSVSVVLDDFAVLTPEDSLELNRLKLAVRLSILSASAISSSSSFFHPSFSHNLLMTWSQFPNNATSL